MVAPLKVLIQHLCTKVPDRAEYRNRLAPVSLASTLERASSIFPYSPPSPLASLPSSSLSHPFLVCLPSSPNPPTHPSPWHYHPFLLLHPPSISILRSLLYTYICIYTYLTFMKEHPLMMWYLHFLSLPLSSFPLQGCDEASLTVFWRALFSTVGLDLQVLS